jgi:transposase
LRASHRQPREEDPLKPEQLERENERLSREVERLRQELIERDKKIFELERKLALRLQNSTTSSKPPSSDGLAGEQRPRCSRRKKSRCKPGGQPGHRGHWRGLAPLSRVDRVIEVFPPKCRHCDSRLSRRMSTQGEARRHQVTELPPIEAHITEYRCQCVVCPECGKATQAELPGEAQGHFGPQLTALIAYLTVVCRMPRRMVRELLEQVLAIPLSLGSIQNSWEETSQAVAEPCAELERQLPHEPVVNSDETGYRTSGEKRWLWALVAANFVFYKIALTRGAEVLVELLGEVFAGILCSDRCASYLKYHKGEGQFCWAHFKRNILGHCCPAKLFRGRTSYFESVVWGRVWIFRFECFSGLKCTVQYVTAALVGSKTMRSEHWSDRFRSTHGTPSPIRVPEMRSSVSRRRAP